MRVISGVKRGLKLSAPVGNDTRPTLDRVKEAVFSMLFPILRDAIVLDLFAGSGALGIEALSRGSKKAVFVDNSDKAINCIKHNLSSAEMLKYSEIHKCSAFSYLQKCSDKFDIIFLDPPYAEALYNQSLDLIKQQDILNTNGYIIAEWDNFYGRPDFPQDFIQEKDRRYGRVCISVLKRS